jgi:hypothetical protein
MDMESWKNLINFGRIDNLKNHNANWTIWKVNMSDITVDINQSGDQKFAIMGNTYGEFRVTNITRDTIIMKNNDTITIEPGKEIMLMKGAKKIKV